MSRERVNVQTPIHGLIASRWSTCAFAESPVETEKLASCLEAARWAPSCYNDQPWRLLVANRDGEIDAWQKLFDCLAPGNQSWAKWAPMLVLACASSRFEHNGRPNRWGAYDTGQAMMAFSLQATALGLVTHQMGGFDPERVRRVFAIPDEFTLMSITALGYPADSSLLDDTKLRQRESAPRLRKPLHEFAFSGDWGRSFESPDNADQEMRCGETAAGAPPRICREPGDDLEMTEDERKNHD